jgi:lysosomal acid lipase/cholesteryl ester hydrolase
VGHSQGTLTFYIAMETNPDLNEKVNLMFALAPITTVAHMRSPLRLIAPYADNLEVKNRLLYRPIINMNYMIDFACRKS